MTRRQRQGKGGRDHHGCGKARCGLCHPEPRAKTRQEKAATLDDVAEGVRRRELRQRLVDLDLA